MHTMSGQQFDEVIPFIALAKVVAADTTTLKQVFGGTPNGTRLDAILVASDDTVDRVLDVWLVKSAVNYLLGSATIPAGTGTAGTKSLDLLAEVLPTPIVGIWLDSSVLLDVACETTVTAAKTIHITALGGVT
jgi:hypothetical protein